MEPEVIAENVFDRVYDYCTRHHDAPLECLADHTPDQLSVFIDAYLTNEEDNAINEAVENSDDKFWDTIQEEYKRLWKERMSTDVGSALGDILHWTAEDIMEDAKLDDASKVGYLKAYAEVLDKFGDAVKHALQNSNPLSSADLDDWYMKIANAVSIKNYAYSEDVSYFLDFYSMLDDDDRLHALSVLLDDIADVLYDIEQKYLPELRALTNNNS